jgi:hypothetical protein
MHVMHDRMEHTFFYNIQQVVIECKQLEIAWENYMAFSMFQLTLNF